LLTAVDKCEAELVDQVGLVWHRSANLLRGAFLPKSELIAEIAAAHPHWRDGVMATSKPSWPRSSME
jgi:hypothetical protein